MKITDGDCESLAILNVEDMHNTLQKLEIDFLLWKRLNFDNDNLEYYSSCKTLSFKFHYDSFGLANLSAKSRDVSKNVHKLILYGINDFFLIYQISKISKS